MSGPILEDPFSLGDEDTCGKCEEVEKYCECGIDPDDAYDRMMEEL